MRLAVAGAIHPPDYRDDRAGQVDHPGTHFLRNPVTVIGFRFGQDTVDTGDAVLELQIDEPALAAPVVLLPRRNRFHLIFLDIAPGIGLHPPGK